MDDDQFSKDGGMVFSLFMPFVVIVVSLALLFLGII